MLRSTGLNFRTGVRSSEGKPAVLSGGAARPRQWVGRRWATQVLREVLIRHSLAFGGPKTRHCASPELSLTGRSVYLRLNKQPETIKNCPWRAHLASWSPSICGDDPRTSKPSTCPWPP